MKKVKRVVIFLKGPENSFCRAFGKELIKHIMLMSPKQVEICEEFNSGNPLMDHESVTRNWLSSHDGRLLFRRQ